MKNGSFRYRWVTLFGPRWDGRRRRERGNNTAPASVPTVRLRAAYPERCTATAAAAPRSAARAGAACCGRAAIRPQRRSRDVRLRPLGVRSTLPRLVLGLADLV